MQINPIAHFRSPLDSKFGIPRQSGLVEELTGQIVFTPPYRHAEAVRGLEHFDFAWLIWEFSANGDGDGSLTVRPPRLGGNQRMGVFATRSPFRPNRLGLSSVRIECIEQHPRLGPVIHVRGADLMDGTPIYDVKPYVTFADSHPDARSGFVDDSQWRELQVVMPAELAAPFTPGQWAALRRLLALDPRPRYHDDSSRTYGMPFAGHDVRFSVSGNVLTVTEITAAGEHD